MFKPLTSLSCFFHDPEEENIFENIVGQNASHNHYPFSQQCPSPLQASPDFE